DGRLVTAKASSTPGDFSEGVMESLRLAGEKVGHTTEALLRDTDRLALGTTVGTNAMLQRRGARVGLITTRGHRDVIHIMRGARGDPALGRVRAHGGDRAQRVPRPRDVALSRAAADAGPGERAPLSAPGHAVRRRPARSDGIPVRSR